MFLNEITQADPESSVLPHDIVPAFLEAMDKAASGIDDITDMPSYSAQVEIDPASLDLVIKTMTQLALEHCSTGDAVRLWMRQNNDRVLIVVDHTGTSEAAERHDTITSASGNPTRWKPRTGIDLIELVIEDAGGVAWYEPILDRGVVVGGRTVVGLPAMPD